MVRFTKNGFTKNETKCNRLLVLSQEDFRRSINFWPICIRPKKRINIIPKVLTARQSLETGGIIYGFNSIQWRRHYFYRIKLSQNTFHMGFNIRSSESIKCLLEFLNVSYSNVCKNTEFYHCPNCFKKAGEKE